MKHHETHLVTVSVQNNHSRELVHYSLTMDKLNLFLTILCVCYTEATILKCCKEDEVIVEDRVDNKAIYNCSNDTELIPLKYNNFIYGFPKCASLKTCIDKTEKGSIIELNCNKQKVMKKALNIHKENKCCPENMIYNYEKRICENKDSITQLQLGDNILNLLVGMPDCDGVVVDVPLNEKQDFKNLNDFNKTLLEAFNKISEGVPDDFCYDFNKNNNLIFRFCLHIKNCVDNFKCVRKCCQPGEVYVNAVVGGMKCVKMLDKHFDLGEFNFTANESGM